MLRLHCAVKFRIFDPLPAYRKSCPYTLVIDHGIHPHPIPLPQKTPPVLRSEIFGLLENMKDDLPDLTSRRFLRHPVLKAYLSTRFPEIAVPTLSDLHVSLANRSHLKSYINIAKEEHFPAGTGWEGKLIHSHSTYVSHKYNIGAIYLKKQQDLHFATVDHYIRSIIEIPGDLQDIHDEDEAPSSGASDVLRIIICMSKEGSERLLKAQYPSSDIAFKRVVGFYEFEMACMDRISNTSTYN
jgi:hypothetical protein